MPRLAVGRSDGEWLRVAEAARAAQKASLAVLLAKYGTVRVREYGAKGHAVGHGGTQQMKREQTGPDLTLRDH